MLRGQSGEGRAGPSKAKRVSLPWGCSGPSLRESPRQEEDTGDQTCWPPTASLLVPGLCSGKHHGRREWACVSRAGWQGRLGAREPPPEKDGHRSGVAATARPLGTRARLGGRWEKEWAWAEALMSSLPSFEGEF